MPIQNRNTQMSDLTGVDAQKRYDPAFSIANLLSVMSLAPQIRGYWPLNQWYLATYYDATPIARDLTANGAPTPGLQSLTQFQSVVGNASNFVRADEAPLETRLGMTAGGWFRFTGAGAAAETCFSKWTAAGNLRTWRMQRTIATGELQVDISSLGTAASIISVTSTGGALPLNAWKFLAFKHIVSAELSCWVNDAKFTQLVGVPASLYNGTASLVIGSEGGAVQYLTGDVCHCFLANEAWDDAKIESVYECSKSLFGVL